MFVNFFIDRPIFSAVISIIITIAGALSLLALPIAQYPEISPPTVQVSASYSGAAAQVVEQTVATPIEQQVNGAEEMMYMSSISANSGSMALTVTFEVGRDLDMATVDIQNRVSLAESSLPDDVTRAGLTVKKQSPNMLLIANLVSPDETFDALFLNNYATINIADIIGRIPGVGSVTVFGAGDYAMRVWLDPGRLKELGLTVSDVISAVQDQNVQAPAGQIGQPPVASDVDFQYTVQVKGRLAEVEEFKNVIIRAEGDRYIRIKDVATVEMASESYTNFGRHNGMPMAGILIYQLPGANALDVAAQVRSVMADLSKNFPKGLEYKIPYDTTKFVTASIDEVKQTLIEAIILVLLVVFIFLQNWRATIIPMIAVPVSLVGTFAFFGILDFSLNTLTLFGLVLAIGIVVDDAIVVVEATQRYLDEEGMSPKEATKQAMADVTAPAIANSLVLCAVFVPVAFMGGITGRLYQQFALTLAVSVLISTVNALTLSPALSAIMLRPATEVKGPLGLFFRGFNKVFGAITNVYNAVVKGAVKQKFLTFLILAALFAATAWSVLTLPTGFVPSEDQGYFIVNVQLPEAASQARNDALMKKIEAYLSKAPGVSDYVALGGMNLLNGSYSSYTSAVFVILDPWDERQTPELSLEAILGMAQQTFWSFEEGIVMCFNPPPISGLGTTGGFSFELQDRAGGSVADLTKAADQFLAEARKAPEVKNLFTSFTASVPQIFVDIDRDKVKSLGVPLSDVFQALQTNLGGYYINDFNKFGRTYRVMLQAQSKYRATPTDIGAFYVRSQNGDMIPLSTLVTVNETTGPEYIQRYNLYKTVEITGSPADGYSSGEAIAAMERVAATALPQGYGYEWTGMAYQEKQSGSQSIYIFALALVMVFLFLAAQYESWAIPFAVLFCIPLGILGAMLGQHLRGLDNNVYAQIGLVMLIGLAAKNAVLIVEYAKQKHEEGYSVIDAALEAAHLRFRPILMTSFAFILGVFPLVIASGAGAASRHSLGTAVFAGMIFATCLGVIAVPWLYAVIQGMMGKKEKAEKKT